MKNNGSKSAHDKTDQQKENESIIAAHKEADKDMELDTDLSPSPKPPMTLMKVSWQGWKGRNNVIK